VTKEIRVIPELQEQLVPLENKVKKVILVPQEQLESKVSKV
jgi:hypothetical protein|tara:strand:+ start:534 stop:656 length:123 start_codon:yes stop_codon:yes gene_type:complete